MLYPRNYIYYIQGIPPKNYPYYIEILLLNFLFSKTKQTFLCYIFVLRIKLPRINKQSIVRGILSRFRK